jgi:hypothetical protein
MENSFLKLGKILLFIPPFGRYLAFLGSQKFVKHKS